MMRNSYHTNDLKNKDLNNNEIKKYYKLQIAKKFLELRRSKKNEKK